MIEVLPEGQKKFIRFLMEQIGKGKNYVIISLSVIQEKLQLTPPAIYANIRALEKKGFVKVEKEIIEGRAHNKYVLLKGV